MSLIKHTAIVVSAVILFSCSGNEKGKGDELFQAGEYQQAVEAYSRELGLNPDNVSLLYNRARAHEELGNYEKAMEDFKAALEQDDRNVKVLIGLGDVFYKQKDYENALYHYKQAAQFEKNNAVALFKVGNAHHQLGNVEEAMDYYNDALRENQQYGDAYYYRGALKVSQKKVSSACEDFRKAQSLQVAGAGEALQKYCR
ncbi:tetratricopeptide repeat protein [Nafulsella turpanensis]|uniref:tetratricopeptide repeat protein n=1 Tax=Nafulsella turpanensis TaxID=1265690 RepID=UPI00034B2EAA|nr:tetratricopeptide repeat protein [Nafulsella turpanensis]